MFNSYVKTLGHGTVRKKKTFTFEYLSIEESVKEQEVAHVVLRLEM